MKTPALTVTCLGLILAGSGARAQQAPPPAPARPPAVQVVGDRRAHADASREERLRESRSEFLGDLESALPDLHLTAEQQTAVDGKTQAMQAALGDWEKQNQARMTQLRTEAQQAGQKADRDAMHKVQEAVRAMVEERARIGTEFRTQVLAILTPEQRLTLGGLQMLQDREFQSALATLQLPPEQENHLKEKVEAWGVLLAKWDEENDGTYQKLQQQQAEIEAQLRPLRDARDKLANAWKADIAAMLTPEQKTALIVNRLQDMFLGRGLKGQLTDEQSAKLKAICEQAVQDAGPTLETDPRVAEQLRAKVIAQVRDQVLTPEQRAQLDGVRQAVGGPATAR